jgi:hypothetical protein
MAGENKYDETGDAFKMFIKESLMQQRNKMMDSFAQILRRLPTGDTSSLNGGNAPFKVKINFDIPIDADVVDKWLNLLEGYFSIHKFSNKEKNTFSLLKVVPHVKYWWETFCEQKEIEETLLFSVMTTCESFRDAIKKQYYPVELGMLLGMLFTERLGSNTCSIFSRFCTPCDITSYTPTWENAPLAWTGSIT